MPTVTIRPTLSDSKDSTTDVGKNIVASNAVSTLRSIRILEITSGIAKNTEKTRIEERR